MLTVCIFSGLLACTRTDETKATASALFELVDLNKTGITFRNELTPDSSLNILTYLYYYNGGGVVLANFVGDDLPDIFLTANQGDNVLYENLGAWRFQKVNCSVLKGQNAWSSGASAVDINSDGLLDIYVNYVNNVGGLPGRNELFINTGSGCFVESAEEYGLNLASAAVQTAFYDADGDGDMDAFLLNQSAHDPANYSDTIQRDVLDDQAGDQFFENIDGIFVNRTDQVGIYSAKVGYGLGLAIGDVSGDGNPDVYVANDFHENDYLYQYDQTNESYVEISNRALAHTSRFSMGCDIADFNYDGKLDIMSLDMDVKAEHIRKRVGGYESTQIYQLKRNFGYNHQLSRNCVQLNLGNSSAGAPFFKEVSPRYGWSSSDWSWSVLAADYDFNGEVEAYVANGIIGRPNDLDYLKFGITGNKISTTEDILKKAQRLPSGLVKDVLYSQSKAPVAYGKPDATTGLAYTDMDGDGDLDLVGNVVNGFPKLLRNLSSVPELFNVTIVGPPKNIEGLGSTLTAHFIKNRKSAYSITRVRGFQSSSQLFPPIPKEGLDSLCIRWPDRTQTCRSFNSKDNSIVLRHQDSQPVQPLPLQPFQYAIEPESIDSFASSSAEIDNDPLLITPTLTPWKSFRDRGGLSLPMARGAYDNPYISLKGSFTAVGANDTLFAATALRSVGPIPATSSRVVLINTESNSGYVNLPPLRSALVVDLDGNGIDEVVVSTLSNSNTTIQTNIYILSFVDGKSQIVASAQVDGSISTIAPIHLNNSTDCLLSGLYTPVYHLHLNSLQAANISIDSIAPNGFWQSISDNLSATDQELKIVAGNIGRQLRISGNEDVPIKTYVADFDQNGTAEVIVTHVVDSTRHTFHGLEALSGRMPMLRRIFQRHADFADRAFSELFPPGVLGLAQQLQITSLDSYLLTYDFTSKSWTSQSLPSECQDQAIGLAAKLDKDHFVVIPTTYQIEPSLGHLQAQVIQVVSLKDLEVTANMYQPIREYFSPTDLYLDRNTLFIRYTELLN